MKPDEVRPRLKWYSYLVIALLSVLLFRLAVVQLLFNTEYQTKAKENRVRLVPIKAARGEIYDRNGKVLAANELVYTLSLSNTAMNNQSEVVGRLVSLLKPAYPEITAEVINEKIRLQRNRLYEPVVLLRDIPWELVVLLEEHRQELPGVEIEVEPLRTYPQGALAGHVLGYIHSITPEEIDQNQDYKYGLSSLIGKSGVEKQYEKELRGQDGARNVEVDSRGRPVRELVTLEPRQGNNIYLTLDHDLQQVMEQSMENMLATLQPRHPLARVASAVLLNVRTGQVLAMSSMPAMVPDDWKGNISSQRAAYYFPQGEEYDPMNPGAFLNRAIQVSYAPGSTFKPITGMAALESGLMDPAKDYVNCKGAYWIAPYIKCWGVHGNVNYYSGMAGSCNVYFQEMGRRVGQENIVKIAREFGLGSKTGIDLPYETSGLLPTPEWKSELNALLTDRKYGDLKQQIEEKYQTLLDQAPDEEARLKLETQKKNEIAKWEAQYQIDYNFNTKWQAYDTFNMSIGEGYNDYTVLQLANFAAAVANGGKVLQPYVVDRIVSPDGRVIQQASPIVVHEAAVSSMTLAETRQAMLSVTEPGGTGYFLFNNFPANIRVAAKTGTAQNRRAADGSSQNYNGVFLAFAPFDNPEIAFAGVVEYGYHGSESVGIVARDVFEQYFGLKDHRLDNAGKNQVNQNMSNIAVD
jgi:penicillin-binding protein 2